MCCVEIYLGSHHQVTLLGGSLPTKNCIQQQMALARKRNLAKEDLAVFILEKHLMVFK